MCDGVLSMYMYYQIKQLYERYKTEFRFSVTVFKLWYGFDEYTPATDLNSREKMSGILIQTHMSLKINTNVSKYSSFLRGI